MDTSISKIDTETERALTQFVMDCTDLTALEALLSRFNIFRVLRAAKHEIRHSNMLAWLLTPDESHGLGDRFFRRWLMQVVHKADDDTKRRLQLPSPIEIDAFDIESVEVARERENIDLFLIVRSINGTSWTICIENKVESTQHSNQLQRYREIVERRYPDAEHRLFVFLTKNQEIPDDIDFITSSYAVVESVLSMCLKEKGDLIGSEPRLLITQYLKLLEEDFVEENRAAELARKIYRSHRKAIDFILENRDDPISEASAVMKEFLTAHSEELGIILDVQNKGWVRFIPKEWNVPQNGGGTAWGPNSHIVLCEISFWTKNAELQITVGDAPDAWADKVWERAAIAPFKQEWKKRPAKYVKPFKAKSDIAVAMLADAEPDTVETNLADWIKKELHSERFREAVKVMRALMEELPEKPL